MVLFLVGLASCTSRSGRKASKEDEKMLAASEFKTEPNVKVWKVMLETTAFEFIDKQDLIATMKNHGLDSIHISRTIEIHSDSTKLSHVGEWVIPFDKAYPDEWTEYHGLDTIYHEIQAITLPARAFILKE
jgi:hypothetical protein